MSTLEQITAAATAEPVELPRLTVANTFVTYNRLVAQLRVAGELGVHLPDCNTPQDSDACLKDLVKACESVIRYANRLLEANR